MQEEPTIFYSSFELVIVQSKGRRFLVKCELDYDYFRRKDC